MTPSRTQQEITLVDVPCEIEYHYYRGCRGARDGKYGPPLEPDEPADVEIESVKFGDVEMIEYVTEDDLQKMAQNILDDIQAGE